MMTGAATRTDQKLFGETSRIAWKELQFFFAAGKAVYVATELDLINVATQITNDNKAIVEEWMQKNQVMPVPDDKAKMWHKEDAIVWAIVVKPWVLLQEAKIKPLNNGD